jgi:hypothetical protein
VSPVLKYKDLIEYNTLNKFYESIQVNGAFEYYNNVTTSNHIHYSFGDLQTIPENIIKITKAWWIFEPIIFFMVGHWRRTNEYCQPLHRRLRTRYGHGNAKSLFLQLNHVNFKHFFNTISPGTQGDTDYVPLIVGLFQGTNQKDRYAALNLLNLLNSGDNKTIEIRMKQGSVDMIENTAYIFMFAKFFFNIMDIDSNFLSLGNLEIFWDLWDSLERKNLSQLPFPISQDEKIALELLFNSFFEIVRINATEAEEAFLDRNKVHFQGLIDRHLVWQSGGCPEKVPKFLFSYGSNNTEQLGKRVGRKNIKCYPAYINNYTRIFAGHSKLWGGGVASIHKKSNHRVYGNLVEMYDHELEALDKYESTYERVKLKAVCQQEPVTTTEAYVYIRKDFTFVSVPSVKYLRAIRKMLDETNRPYRRANIIIRRVVIVNDKAVVQHIGTWDPNSGMLTRAF